MDPAGVDFAVLYKAKTICLAECNMGEAARCKFPHSTHDINLSRNGITDVSKLVFVGPKTARRRIGLESGLRLDLSFNPIRNIHKLDYWRADTLDLSGTGIRDAVVFNSMRTLLGRTDSVCLRGNEITTTEGWVLDRNIGIDLSDNMLTAVPTFVMERTYSEIDFVGNPITDLYSLFASTMGDTLWMYHYLIAFRGCPLDTASRSIMTAYQTTSSNEFSYYMAAVVKLLRVLVDGRVPRDLCRCLRAYLI